MAEAQKDRESAFNSSLSTLDRIGVQLRNANTLFIIANNIEDYVKINNVLDVIFSEVYPMLDKTEKDMGKGIRDELKAILSEHTQRMGGYTDPYSRKARLLCINLKPILYKYNLYVRQMMHKHKMLLATQDDPGRALTA